MKISQYYYLHCFDPGLTTGWSKFFISESSITLVDFGAMKWDQLDILLLAELNKRSFVVVEKFVNPFATLTKEAVTTIELVGAIKYAAHINAKGWKEQIQAQKAGYMAYAKELMARRTHTLKAEKRHAIDAIAHGLRYINKELGKDLKEVK